MRSAFTWEPGTLRRTKEDTDMEQAIISAVTHDTDEAKVTVAGVPDQPGIAGTAVPGAGRRDINVDMIVQNTSEQGLTDISFTVPQGEAETSQAVCEGLAAEIGADGRHAPTPTSPA